MKTTTQNRAEQCRSLEAYFTQKCIYAAMYGLHLRASHFARRALLAADMARFHSANSDIAKTFASGMIARTVQHFANMRRYTI